jgi:hypothetical protein
MSQRDLDRAYGLLKEAEWSKGFNLYECREIRKVKFSLGMKTPLSRSIIWEPGYDVRDRHLIVTNEQGVGDTIMFSRFIPLLKELPVKSVSVYMQKPLMNLIASLEGVDGVLSDENCAVPAMRVKVMSIPALLMQYNKFPMNDGDPVYKSEGYFKFKGIRKTSQIGFCWYSDNDSWNASAKVIPRNLAEKFYNQLTKKHKVVSLQIQPDFMPENLDGRSWLETAKKIQSLKAVVTVDTGVAHLAGALGVRTLNLVGSASKTGWFYLPTGTDKTTWYDSMELIRYEPYTNWEAGLDEALKRLCR